MPDIRQATAALRMEDGAPRFEQASLENDDREDRQIIGAVLSVFASNDTLSSQTGVTAVWSTQTLVDSGSQQGLYTSRPTTDTDSTMDASRAGPFLVADNSGRDSRENAVVIASDFGSADAWIPWPAGGEIHLGAVALAADDNGFRVNGIVYYQESASASL